MSPRQSSQLEIRRIRHPLDSLLDCRPLASTRRAVMKVGVLGSGVVVEALANGFLKKGHEVMRGSRDPSKLMDWKTSAGNRASTGTFAATAAHGELIVLAVKGTAAAEAVQACG